MNINPRVIYQGHVSLANTKYVKVFRALLVTQLQFGSEVSSWGNLSIKEGSLFGLSHIWDLPNHHAFGIVGKPLMSCVGIVRWFRNV